VVTKPPREAGKEALLLATTEAITKYYQQPRNMLAHDMSLVLFGKVDHIRRDRTGAERIGSTR
jgi:hypothetical protein